MGPTRNQREVENRLRDALKVDRARVQVGRISRFGLLEMSRQRLRPSISETIQKVCPRCSGGGKIRSVESLSVSLIRVIEEEALKPHSARINVQLPVEVATYIMNEKREIVAAIEKRQMVSVIIIPNPHLETPHYEITRIKEGEGDGGKGDEVKSYQLATKPELEIAAAKSKQRVVVEPAVKSIMEQPATAKRSRPGFLKKLIKKIFNTTATKRKESTKKRAPSHHRPQRSGSRTGQQRRPQRGRSGDRRDDRGTRGRRDSKVSRDQKDSRTDREGKTDQERSSRPSQPRSQQSRSRSQQRRRPRTDRDKPHSSSSASSSASSPASSASQQALERAEAIDNKLNNVPKSESKTQGSHGSRDSHGSHGSRSDRDSRGSHDSHGSQGPASSEALKQQQEGRKRQQEESQTQPQVQSQTQTEAQPKEQQPEQGDKKE